MQLLESEPCERQEIMFTQVNWEIIFQFYLSDRHQQTIQYISELVIFPLLGTAGEHSYLKWKKKKKKKEGG